MTEPYDGTREQADSLFWAVKRAQDREHGIDLIWKALHLKDEVHHAACARYKQRMADQMTRIQQMLAVLQVIRSRLRDLPASATAVAIDDACADLLGEPRVDDPARRQAGILHSKNWEV